MTETVSLSQLLVTHRFFRGLSMEQIDKIASCGEDVRFHSNQFIFHEGDPAKDFYIIRQGQVMLEMYTSSRGHVNISTLCDDDVLGWSWLFPPYKWHMSARTTKFTRAIVLDGHALKEKCDADHTLGYELMSRFATIVVDRLKKTRSEVANMYGQRTWR